jgi:hypothetical protein
MNGNALDILILDGVIEEFCGGGAMRGFSAVVIVLGRLSDLFSMIEGAF